LWSYVKWLKKAKIIIVWKKLNCSYRYYITYTNHNSFKLSNNVTSFGISFFKVFKIILSLQIQLCSSVVYLCNFVLYEILDATASTRILAKNPIVEMDGDEMTRIMWEKIKETLIFPYIKVCFTMFFLSVSIFCNLF